jgi:hypothetical protein
LSTNEVVVLKTHFDLAHTEHGCRLYKENVLEPRGIGLHRLEPFWHRFKKKKESFGIDLESSGTVFGIISKSDETVWGRFEIAFGVFSNRFSGRVEHVLELVWIDLGSPWGR